MKKHSKRHLRNLSNLQNEFEVIYREHRIETERLEKKNDQ